ncbi:MAG: hypothetical protein WCT77_03670 [Bacteroidota bacterium]
MIEELRKIRNRLEDAVNSQDWWVVKSQMNKIDTILYNDRKSEVKNLSLSDVSKRSELFINFTKEVIEYWERYQIGDEDIYEKAKKLINGC